jgi:hypothetical protein
MTEMEKLAVHTSHEDAPPVPLPLLILSQPDARFRKLPERECGHQRLGHDMGDKMMGKRVSPCRRT